MAVEITKVKPKKVSVSVEVLQQTVSAAVQAAVSAHKPQ